MQGEKIRNRTSCLTMMFDLRFVFVIPVVFAGVKQDKTKNWQVGCKTGRSKRVWQKLNPEPEFFFRTRTRLNPIR